MALKERQQYFKNKIYSIGLTQSVKNHNEQDYNEFLGLFKNHPDHPKKTEGISDIFIVRNKMNPKCYELGILKDDGTSDNISYLACCKTKQDELKSLKAAMRYSIKPQIDEFKRKNNVSKCVYCGSFSNIEIDHDEPSFKKLFEDFLAKNQNFPTVFAETYYNTASFTENDKDFHEKWYKYHWTHAKLQPLCKKCNMTKKKN